MKSPSFYWHCFNSSSKFLNFIMNELKVIVYLVSQALNQRRNKNIWWFISIDEWHWKKISFTLISSILFPTNYAIKKNKQITPLMLNYQHWRDQSFLWLTAMSCCGGYTHCWYNLEKLNREHMIYARVKRTQYIILELIAQYFFHN